jgi:pimeloyl-ACP methyl ester carboxylesterase
VIFIAVRISGSRRALAPGLDPERDWSVMPPPTRYARSGDVHLAYQVVGEGPLDLVFVHGWVSNVEYGWEVPPLARFLNRLASFSRLILFDRRGTGMSDRVPEHALPTLEQRMDDIRTVMDAAGSERAAIFGASEGGNMSILFAATYPERTVALVTVGIFAKRIWSPEYPWAPTPEQRQKDYEVVEREWDGEMDVTDYAPSADPALRAQIATFFRRSASPGAALALLRMNTQMDVRHVLPAVRVPTLVLHRTHDRDARVEEGRWIASQIPGAVFVELSGADHLPWVGDTDALVDEVEEFLTGVRRASEADRVLATVLFTDIVDATATAAALGDRGWRDLLQAHHAAVRRELARFRGREIDTAGDGFLAGFDGPARAVRCACAIRDAVAGLGVRIRAGLHTGECEVIGDKLGGLAVHIGARVAAAAPPAEVWVSSTVKDLVAGSGLRFADRGLHALKGVPGEWRLFAVDQ